MIVPASVMDSQHIWMTQILADCLLCPNFFSETEKLSVTGHTLKSRLIKLPCRTKRFVSNPSHRVGAICWPTDSFNAVFSKQTLRAHELVLALKFWILRSYILLSRKPVERINKGFDFYPAAWRRSLSSHPALLAPSPWKGRGQRKGTVESRRRELASIALKGAAKLTPSANSIKEKWRSPTQRASVEPASWFMANPREEVAGR